MKDQEKISALADMITHGKQSRGQVRREHGQAVYREVRKLIAEDIQREAKLPSAGGAELVLTAETAAKYYVAPTSFGHVPDDMSDAAEAFAESIDPACLVGLSGEARGDQLSRLFRAATPEFDSPPQSCATDQRDQICFDLVALDD